MYSYLDRLTAVRYTRYICKAFPTFSVKHKSQPACSLSLLSLWHWPSNNIPVNHTSNLLLAALVYSFPSIHYNSGVCGGFGFTTPDKLTKRYYNDLVLPPPTELSPRY